jgi:ferredoxin
VAEKGSKQPENTPGKWYVDINCIDCDVCRETAPNNFTQQTQKGYSYVYKQPENAAEEAQSVEAMESCPVNAIGNDGDK